MPEEGDSRNQSLDKILEETDHVKPELVAAVLEATGDSDNGVDETKEDNAGLPKSPKANAEATADITKELANATQKPLEK